jgi:hypothetical protein
MTKPNKSNSCSWIIEKYPVNKAIKLLTDAIDKGMRYYDLELADLYIRYNTKFKKQQYYK